MLKVKNLSNFAKGIGIVSQVKLVEVLFEVKVDNLEMVFEIFRCI